MCAESTCDRFLHCMPDASDEDSGSDDSDEIGSIAASSIVASAVVSAASLPGWNGDWAGPGDVAAPTGAPTALSSDDAGASMHTACLTGDFAMQVMEKSHAAICCLRAEPDLRDRTCFCKWVSESCRQMAWLLHASSSLFCAVTRASSAPIWLCADKCGFSCHIVLQSLLGANTSILPQLRLEFTAQNICDRVR
jgi:hypothetical protein